MTRRNKQRKTWFHKFNQYIEQRNWLIYAYLIALTFIIYHQVLLSDFVNFDDSKLIYNHAIVNSEQVPIKEAFSWGFRRGHYKPLVFLSWWSEYKLFGKAPFIFHFNNLLLHLFNVLLVFFIGKALLVQFKISKEKVLFGSLFLATLFSVHPLHVESVAWAVERKDVLFSFFFLSAWLSYIRYLKSQRIYLLLLVALLYSASMLSKGMGITLIAVLFLTDYLYERRDFSKILLEKLPIYVSFLLGAYWFGLLDNFTNFNNQTSSFALEANATLVQTLDQQQSFLEAIQIHSSKLVLWLAHILLPIKLAVVYDGPSIMKALGPFKYIAPFLLAGLLYLAYRWRNDRKELLFGLLFFLVTIPPALAITLVDGVGVFLSNRYVYIPILGIFFILVVTLLKIKTIGTKSTGMYVFGALTVVLSLLCFNTTKAWRNSETLWTNVLKVSGNIPVAYFGLGNYLSTIEEFERALFNFNQSLNYNPNHVPSRFHKTNILVELERYEEALYNINDCLLRRPKSTIFLEKRAFIHYKLNQIDAAMADINEAIALPEAQQSAYLIRADIFLAEGRLDKALEDVKAAIQLDSFDWLAHQKAAIIYEKKNELENALISINQAIELKPTEARLYNNKGVILLNLGRKEEALATIDQGIKIDNTYYNSFETRNIILQAIAGKTIKPPTPALNASEAIKLPKTYENPEKVYAEYKKSAAQFKEENKIPEAINAYTKCIEIAPDNYSNYIERGILYMNSGKETSAIADFTKGIELNAQFPNALLFRSMAYNNLKQYDQAIKDAQAAKTQGAKVDASYLKKLEADLAKQN